MVADRDYYLPLTLNNYPSALNNFSRKCMLSQKKEGGVRNPALSQNHHSSTSLSEPAIITFEPIKKVGRYLIHSYVSRFNLADRDPAGFYF